MCASVISVLVLSLAHRPSHLGRDKTTQKVLDDFYLPVLHREEKQISRACLDCQKADKKATFPATLYPLPIIDIPFQQIGMDMIWLLPTTAAGNHFILLIVDYAIRWPEAFPLQLTDSKSVADQLLLMFTGVGVIEQILIDYGNNFLSQLLRELYRLLCVQSITTTPNHPTTDGLMERYNGIIKNMVRRNSKLCQGQWDLALPFLLGELRWTLSATTGFTIYMTENHIQTKDWK